MNELKAPNLGGAESSETRPLLHIFLGPTNRLPDLQGRAGIRKFKCDISVPEVPALRLVEAAVGPGQCGSATPVDQVPRNV